MRKRTTGDSVVADMGLGLIGSGECVFARKFRWLLRGERLPSDFMKKVSIDYTKKMLTFSYYDIKHGEDGFYALTWPDFLKAGDLEEDALELTTLDGCGHILYRCTFTGLSVDGHTSDFDYESSDASTQTIAVKYEKVLKEIAGKELQPKNVWKLRLRTSRTKVLTPYIPAVLVQRPSLDIEESEINFLNGKMFVPGKGKWEPAIVIVPCTSTVKAALLDSERFGQRFVAELVLFVDGKRAETWTLYDSWARSINTVGRELEVTLNFEKVQYKNHLCPVPKKEGKLVKKEVKQGS